MAPPLSSRPELAGSPRRLLARLLNLYAEEKRLYRRVLQLSRRQGEIFRRGGSLRDVHEILQQKRACLDAIAELEQADGGARALWEEGKSQWQGEDQVQLHQVLQEVGSIIETILLAEEENDRVLLAKTGTA
jgi:hypothetical protein